jgi:hypothetical protein
MITKDLPESTIDHFGAILHTYWEEDPTNEGQIIGHWAEDNSKYCIVVPVQLRRQIINLQNLLCRHYVNFKRMQHDLIERTNRINKFFQE